MASDQNDIEVNRDLEEMDLDELREHYRAVYDAMDSRHPHHNQPDLWDHHLKVWEEIEVRAEADYPDCPECGQSNWQFPEGQPVVCGYCGNVASEQVEMEVVEESQRVLNGEAVTDGGQDVQETKPRRGVAQHYIPEDEIYRHDENLVFVTDHSDRSGADYWIHLGSKSGKDSSILFDNVRWEAREYGGELWFEREVEGRSVTVACLDYDAANPHPEMGEVDYWLREQIDLSDYRSGVDCPKCGSEILHLRMTSACSNLECDFYCEGMFSKELSKRLEENQQLGEVDNGE